MQPPDTAPRHRLGPLLAAIGRAARYHIAARPGDRHQPVTTSVDWACGCHAEGPSYRELRLTPCPAHLIVAVIDLGGDGDDGDGAAETADVS